MKHGTITIHFQHYWHCGSGQAGEGDVDLLPVVERSGLPYVPGRALRGRLKWAARMAARELGWGDGLINAMFGVEKEVGLKATGMLQVTSATMRDLFANEARRFNAANKGLILPEVSALYEDIANTSLQNGVARAKTLRRVRYAVPVTVIAEVSLNEEGVTWQDLDALVERLRFIGKGKHDGFGWCSAALSEPVAEKANSGGDAGDTGDFELNIELLDDVVLSASGATTGGHRTLDHVPGSALMGVFAGVMFPELRKSGVDAESVGAAALLEGKVSFGNGVPEAGHGSGTVPVPLAWHYAKGKPGAVEDRVQKDRVASFAAKPYEEGRLHGKQPVQMREGWLDFDSGRVVKVPRTQTLKTAIDESAAKYEAAKETALFGYEAIEKGMRFTARIEVTAPAFYPIVRSAFDGKVIRLGRSKGTEFGRARCALKPVAKRDDVSASGRIVLLAESDLALLDENGFPTLEPAPRHFLEQPAGWMLCRERSFLRFRRYSLWNAKRGGPDVERQVISKGSVIVFENKENPSASAKLKLCAGLGQAEGLGRVRPAEKWMTNEEPHFEHPDAPAPTRNPEIAPVVGENIAAWVAERHREKQFDILANRLAQDWSDEWQRVARKSRASLSASQWGRLDEAARDSRDKQELIGKLGEPARENPNTIFGHGRKRKEWAKGDGASVARTILEAVDREADSRLAVAAFRGACHRMAAEKRRNKN